MTRDTFLYELEQRLHALPKFERDEAVQFYREYFDEAGIEREQEVIRELKSPAHVAAKIFAEYSQKQTTVVQPVVKRGFRGMWFIILAIFAAPIAVPIAIALGAVVFSLGLLAVILIPIFFAVAVVILIASAVSLFVQPSFFLFGLGGALILYGCGHLVFSIFKAFIRSIQNFIQGL